MSNQCNHMTAAVVFLELEQVLVTEQTNFLHWLPSLYRLNLSVHEEPLRELWATLAPLALRANLRKLHDQVEPRYVITSRLASRLNKTQMMDLLHRAGLPFVANNLHTMWRTERAGLANRALEIACWFTSPRAAASAFVILDNAASASALSESPFSLQTVACEDGQGMSGAATNRALEILRWQRRATA